MPPRPRIKADVVLALRDHQNKRVARLPQHLRDAIGIQAGEKVHIKGPKGSIIRTTVKSLREEVRDNIIGLNRVDRERLGIELGESVELRKPLPRELIEETEVSRPIWLFSYGSNHPEQLGSRIGRKVKGFPARLPGFHRVFRGFSRMWGCGVASLLKVNEPDAQVYGYVTQLSIEELESLDLWEGVASGEGTTSGAYRRQTFKVVAEIEGQEQYINAVAYVSTSNTFNEPSKEYLKAVVKTISPFWREGGRKVKVSDIPIRKNPLKIQSILAYHGTPKPTFDKFSLEVEKRNTRFEAASVGIWFTDDFDVASQFGFSHFISYEPRIDSTTGDFDRWSDGEVKKYAKTNKIIGKVYACHLKFKNPKVYESDIDNDSLEKMMNDRDQFAEYIDRKRGTVPSGYWKRRMIAQDSDTTNRLFREYLLSQGYDGIVLLNTVWDQFEDRRHTQYAVFSPDQIQIVSQIDPNPAAWKDPDSLW